MYTTSPWPSAAELDAAYGETYRPRSGRFSGPGDRILKITRSRLAGRIDRLAPPGRVLDVGAGEGWLVDALRRHGRCAEGVERGDGAWPAGPWAAIVFWHSLEHLPEPRESLRAAAAELAPEGVLLVAVPNAASLQARAFGDRWFALDPPRHLVHIPEASLLEAMGANGLRVERTSHWRGGQILFGWIHGLVGLTPGHPDLYEALRRPSARWRPMSKRQVRLTVAKAIIAAPLAGGLAVLEVLARRGGTIYVEARRGGG